MGPAVQPPLPGFTALILNFAEIFMLACGLNVSLKKHHRECGHVYNIKRSCMSSTLKLRSAATAEG